MKKDLHILNEDVSNELKEIYKVYKIRTRNVMLNFSLGWTINELISSVFEKYTTEEIISLLKLHNIKLIASNDNPDVCTTMFDTTELLASIKQGEYINKISKSALIELVAALDQVMVELIQYFLPNISLDKSGFKNKKIIVKCNDKKSIQIDSKTLIYPYVVYRHCYDFNIQNNKPPTLFQNKKALLYIRDSIALRHFIIHNNERFDGRETDLFTVRFVNTSHNIPLEFEKNVIDDIYWFHITHLLDFINVMSKYGKINTTSEWKPCSLADIPNDNIYFKGEL